VATLQRSMARVAYYARNVARDAVPQVLFRRRLDALLAGAEREDRAALADRVNYYHQLNGPIRETTFDATIGSIPMKSSYYYYDLKEHARYFPRSFGLRFAFGDKTEAPARPSFVKSRPIGPGSENAILMKLDKFRHFHLPPDRTAFRDKLPTAVWRGEPNNPLRHALVARHAGHPQVDALFASRKARGPTAPLHRTEVDQMRHRYILSVEGVDVATNLKWIMASNSVCLMPAPIYETWFMEGRLRAGTHYGEVRRDFADVAERIAYFEAHPEEAQRIVANAQAHVRQFLDERRERLISLLVMAKYFVLTGQMRPDERIADLIGSNA